MKQLKKFVADANKAFPTNAAKVISTVRANVASVLASSPKTGRTMECDLMDEGIKHLLNQECSKQKIDIKHAHVPAKPPAPSVMKFTRVIPAANPPSNAVGRQATKQKILDKWMIGRGASRISLGDALLADLQDEIGATNGQMDGLSRNVSFYESIAKRLKGKPRTKVRTVWTEAELEKKEVTLWKDEAHDAA